MQQKDSLHLFRKDLLELLLDDLSVPELPVPSGALCSRGSRMFQAQVLPAPMPLHPCSSHSISPPGELLRCRFSHFSFLIHNVLKFEHPQSKTCDKALGTNCLFAQLKEWEERASSQVCIGEWLPVMGNRLSLAGLSE
jgi:hypothetical protein